MAKGNRTINLYKDDLWKDVFYNSVGTYVNVINLELSHEYPLEPLSNYIKIGGGYAFKTSEYKKRGVPIVRISDFNNEQIDISNCVFYNEDKLLSKYELNENDIIICLTGGTIAKLGIVQSGLGKLYMNQRVGRFDILDNSKFEKEYVYWIARSVQSIIKNLAWGAAIPNVSPKQIEKLQFSFPPIDVQKQIIEFLNDLKNNTIQNKIYFNESIENHIIELQNNNVALKEVNSELTHQLDLIKQLRQAFLREAMQGKLVKSTNTAATGQQLLEKIKAEKAQLIAEKKLKKEKPLPPITEDEIPFEIPKHWAWCRLGEICTKVTDGFHNTPKKLLEGKIYISATHIKDKGIKWDECLYVSEKDHLELYKKASPKKGEILITNRGAGCGTPAIIDIDDEFSFQNTALIGFNQSLINNKFVYSFILKSREEIMVKFVNGGLQPMLSNVILKTVPFPLPPNHEQEQIVAKLEELMAFCDGLEQSIKESQTYNEMLLQQVLREALQPKENPKIVTLPNRVIKQPLKTVLAVHIINQCNTSDFGRVKFQKLLFLTEYYCKIDFNSNYVKKVAGPYDEQLIKTIEADFKRLRFFDVVQDKNDYKKVKYTPLSAAGEINTFFLENFPQESLKINNLLMKLRVMSWSDCEIVATIYAVWNNRLIKGEKIDDKLLYDDFMAWDSQKIKYKDSFHKKLFWMKVENIIPDGWGRYINNTITKMESP